MDDEEYLAGLRTELLAAAHRQRSSRPSGWRRGVALAAAAIVVLGVAAALLLVPDTRPAAADVEVSIDGEDFVVRLTSLETRPEEIVEEARAAGLDVRITEVPVGPTQVGRFISLAADQPADFRPIDPESGAFTGFRISRDWDGVLELRLGRPARDGELWASPSNALAPGGPLECEPLLGSTVQAVADRLERTDLDVRWFMLPTPAEVPDPEGFERWRVVAVEALSPQEITVTATVDGSWPFHSERQQLPDDC
jgi:hypothetical protein